MPLEAKKAGCGDTVYVEAGEKPPVWCERCDKDVEAFLDMYEVRVISKAKKERSENLS